MTSTVARGVLLSDPTELESDGSSGEDRDTRKRLHGDLDSTGPKKRRKQTTPLRFPTSLIAEDHGETEEEEDNADVEGKASHSPQTSLQIHPTMKDENLNNEFRCQHCSQFFDSKETLSLHIDNEHTSSSTIQHSLQPSLQTQGQVKLETQPQQREQSGSPVNLSGLSVKSFTASWISGHVQLQPQTQIQSQNEEWSPSNSITSMSSIPNQLPGLPFPPGALASYLPVSGFPPSDSNQILRPPIGPTPIRIFNPDAYCDLCNKEFCNKYFLKTHKANKHGIYVDSPGQNSSGDTNTSGPSYTGVFPNSSIKLEQSQKLDSPATTVQPPPSTGSLPGIACDICQKRFKNEDSLKKHKLKVHNEISENSEESQMLPPSTTANEDERDASLHSLSPGAMEALFKQEFGVEQEDTTFMPAPRHLSPHSIQQARDSGFNAERLRRLGVINPEAFCVICCKEYCNKYFLRTHKMKRHGIIIQDNEKSPGNAANVAISWHQVQTSPLNLIVSGSSATNNLEESHDRLGEDYECKPCGIQFQTFGLFQVHRRKMHENEEQISPNQDYEAESSDLQRGADSISEDLQKLQTMILQLNSLDSGRGAPCAICGKEFDSRMGLRTHMTTEHGAVIEDSSSPMQGTEKSPSVNTGSFNCTVCEKEYSSHDALRKHIAEEHQPITPAIPTSLPQATSNVPITSIPTSLVTSSAQPERKLSVSMTPTSSYCEICNKELCNKYFMKTHMQRMHNIEIENGAQIGGVICNICNKELCSKYFLRVHKHNTHGIVEEGTSSSTKQESYNEATPSTNDSGLKPELGDLSHRYFTHFTEVCSICSRRFRSTKWLKAHLLGDHGKAGVEKWRELEQQHQTTPKSSNRSGSSRSAGHQSSNLKIPNGLELTQHMKVGEYTGLGNQVLSSLFGSSSEDQQLKSYRCSYCSFTTTVLPFLFLHERSHVSPQGNIGTDGDRSFQCPVCSQNFPQSELLHHHLLTQHQFPGLISHFQSPIVNNHPRADIAIEKSNESRDRIDTETKDDPHQSSPQTSVSITMNDLIKIQRPEEPAVQVTPQGAYKCAQCGYATTNLNRIKKHIRKDHRGAAGDPTESVIAELSKTLKDVANKHKVPASYAIPQDVNFNPDKTIMQPFLIEEYQTAQVGEESNPEKRFVPALVYLPVRTRINGIFTASFTLSPA